MSRIPMFAVLLAATFASPVSAEDPEPPFWASTKAGTVNMRVGPGEDYRVLWVYKRVGLPMKVVRTKEGWWRVEDPDGATGWVLGSLMSQRHTGMVRGAGLADMREQPDSASKLKWRLEPGVTGKIGECSAGWCDFSLPTGHQGFVSQDRLWGAQNP
ncbi:SH3 domain-containing protein [Novosphingobium sp. MW5]|nr:SH3 domain-containing protein [Novosphingobium sp. MW5]